MAITCPTDIINYLSLLNSCVHSAFEMLSNTDEKTRDVASVHSNTENIYMLQESIQWLCISDTEISTHIFY